MRSLSLSLGAAILILGAAYAQTTGTGESLPQLPVGQTFKQFEWPIYQDGKLKATLTATQATGITLNRAETTDLQIVINDTITTTVTSPKADLYVAEQKMRTKNTVRIERTDMTATSQDCDFDLKTKKYLLRTNVKVILKHFDVSMNPAGSPTHPAAEGVTPNPSSKPPQTPDSLLDSPGSAATTHSAPTTPPSP